MSTTVPPVAFIGLGAMGLGMATNLSRHSYPVRAYDINAAALSTLTSSFPTASSAPSPAEACAKASVLVVMVATAAQASSVLFGPETGAIHGLPKNATVILCSTVPPKFPGEVKAEFAKQGREDIRVVDAPVSGGTIRAGDGTLTILAAGDVGGTEAEDVLKAMAGPNLWHIDGGLGAGSNVKLLNQLLAGTHTAAACEAMGWAAVLGLDCGWVYEEVTKKGADAKGGRGRGEIWSWMFGNRVPHMLKNDWTPLSATDIILKDMVGFCLTWHSTY